MATFVFLLSPVFFGGLCLLLGETIHLVKKRQNWKGLAKAVIVLDKGRK